MCTKYTKLFFKTEAINLKKWGRGGKTKREKRERKKCRNYNLKKANFTGNQNLKIERYEHIQDGNIEGETG